MLLRLHVQKNFAHNAVRINHERVARRELGDAKVHHRVIQRGDFRLGVREQLEVQPFLGAELLVRVFVLHADAEDYCALLFVLCQIALKIVSPG